MHDSRHTMRRLKFSMAGVSGLLLGVLAIGSFERTVDARTSFECSYSLNQTYNAALRLLRVDLGLKILERDLQAGYLLFDYRSSESGARVVPGSIELIERARVVTVVVQIPAMPRYHEQVLTDRLARKLRDEYGEPVHGTDRPSPPDGGAGGENPAD